MRHQEDENRIFSDISRFFIDTKYTLKNCIHFSIECSVIATLLYSALGYLTNKLELSWQPWWAEIGALGMGHSPLATELSLLFVFGLLIVIGQFVHMLFSLFPVAGKQDKYAVSRYLTLYPGMILCMYFGAVFLDAIINSIKWFVESILSITLYEWLSVTLGFIVILPYLAVVYFVLFVPVIFVQLIKNNYGSKAKLYTILALVGATFMFLYFT